MLPRSEIETYAAIIVTGSPSEQERVVSDIRNQIDVLGHQLVPMQLVIVAREIYGVDKAISIGERFIDLPTIRGRMLFELGKYLAHTGRPQEALCFLQAGCNDSIFDGNQILFLALQLARVGDFDQARKYLSSVEGSYSDCAEEVSIHSEVLKFIEEFGHAKALEIVDAMQSFFKTPDIVSLEQDIKRSLEEKTPYLLLRLGDGEGCYIELDEQHESRYIHYHRANRIEFANFWFNDTRILDDERFASAIKEFNDTIGLANCLGGIANKEGINNQYAIGSRRGIGSLVNNTLKALRLAQENASWAAATPLHPITVHYDLLQTGALKRMLTGRSHVGLISCQTELAKALQRTYAIGHVEYFHVPGEQIHAVQNGEEASSGQHWPQRFLELSRILDEKVDRRGQLFLVAAGMLGKIYAGKLKKSGAVVLDIGAVADLWMSKVTRSFPPLPQGVALSPAPEPLVLVDVGGLGGIGSEWDPFIDDIRPIIFEPNPPEATIIRSKLKGKVKSGLVVERALGNFAEIRSLNVAKSLGCTSLLYPNLSVLNGYSIANNFRITNKIDVDCVRYDSLVTSGEVPKPEVIKIDVQGYEYQVLEGFGEALSSCLAIKLEAHFYQIYEGQKLLHEIIDFLKKYGLVLNALSRGANFDGDLVEVDAYFVCDAKRAERLTENERRKLAIIQEAWKLPKRVHAFGRDQFD